MRIAKLVLFVAFCEMAGVVGAFFTTSSIPTWYAGIRKPDMAPPNWVFAPEWTTLYGLMGVSLFLVWRKIRGKGFGRSAILVFIVQLILNVLWSYLFFGLQSPFLGVVEIAILWFTIAAAIAFFSLSCPISSREAIGPTIHRRQGASSKVSCPLFSIRSHAC